MNKKCLAIPLLCLLSTSVAAASVNVAHDGLTVVDAAGKTMNAQVRIHTHEQPIPRWREGKPAGDHSSCTYSHVPCSVVDYMEIDVDGRALWISRGLYADLADLSTVEVSIDGNEGRIAIEGGDASESYFVEIEFDKERVKRRKLGSSLVPGEVLQETIFYEGTPLD